MSGPTDLESRLARVETSLERLIELLEADRTPFRKASGTAQDALSSIYGEEEIRERMGELVLRLGEPETVEALTRIGVLLPNIEYALQAVAGGPELIEEGLEMVRREMANRGVEHADAQQRVQAATDALAQLSEPTTLRVLTRLAHTTPGAAPMVEALGEAGHDLAEVEGEDAFKARLKETLVLLVQDETLSSLARIAALAPQIEYAVTALSAGPEMMEEGMEMIQNAARRSGLTTHDLNVRASAALDALSKLSDPAILKALGKVDVPSLLQFTEVVAQPENKEALLKLVALAPALEPPLSALPVQERTLEILRNVNEAVESSAANQKSVGVFGLLGALNDPDVQRALGFALEVSKKLGAHLREPQAKRLKP
ncbi:MAG: DUF1641 domain-containing protein [Myxococcota bacterium]